MKTCQVQKIIEDYQYDNQPKNLFEKSFFGWFVFSFILFFFFVFTTDTLAANRYWVGPEGGAVNGSANYWATSTGGVGGAGVPGASDVAIFDGGGNTSATVSSTWSIAGLQLLTGYGSTLTINNNATTSVAGSITTQAGTLVGPVNMTTTGAFTQTGADISNLSFFSSGQGNRTFTGSGSTTIKHFGMSQQYTSTDLSLGAGTILIVTGQTYLCQGTLGAAGGNTGSLNVRGNLDFGFNGCSWNNPGTLNPIIIDGSGDQIITGNSVTTGTLNTGSLIIAKPSGTVTFTGANVYGGRYGFYTTGTVYFNSGIATGSLGFSGNINIIYNGGDISGLNFYSLGSGNRIFTSNSGTTTINYLYESHQYTSTDFSLGSNTVLIVSSQVDFNQGTFNVSSGAASSSLNIRGGLTVSGSWSNPGFYGQITIDGSGDQTITGVSVTANPLTTMPLVISKPSGTVNFTGTTAVAGYYGLSTIGNIIFNSGTVTGAIGFNGYGKTITYNGGDISALNLFTYCSGACYYSSTGTSTINYLRVNNSTGIGFSLSASTTLVVTGNVDLVNGYLNSTAGYTGTMVVRGDLKYGFSNGGWSGGTYGQITMDGTGTQTISGYAYNSTGLGTFSLIISKPSGGLNIVGTTTVGGYSGANFTGGITFNSNTVVTGTIGFYPGTATITNNGADLSAVNLFVVAGNAGNAYFSSNGTTTINYLRVGNWTGRPFSLSASTTLVVTGNVDLVTGYLNTTAGYTGTLVIRGDLRYEFGGGSWYGGTYGQIIMDGTSTQTITGYAYNSGDLGTFPLIISKPSGGLNIVGTTTVGGINGARFAGNITFNSNTVVTGTITLAGSGRTITNNGADLSAVNLYTMSETNAYAYFSSNGTTTINYLKVSNTSVGHAFNLSSTTILVVSGNVDFSYGGFNVLAGYTGTLVVRGDLKYGFNSGWYGGTYGQITMDGTSTQTISGYAYNSTDLGTFPLIISKPSGGLNIVGTTTVGGINGARFAGNITFNSNTVVTGTIGFYGSTKTITNNGADLSAVNLYSVAGTNAYVYFTSSGTTTINYLNVSNTTLGFELTSGTKLVVNGNVDLGNGYLNALVADTGILYIKGNLIVNNSWGGGTYGQIFINGTNDQLISTVANVANPTVINKTTGVATASSTTLLFSNLNVATGTLDMNGKAATISTFAVAASGTIKMLGTEGTMSTPTLNTNSTVWYYGTTTAGTLKNWAYKNLTINSASTTNVFSFPSAIAATTTTITSGVLYTAGYNFTGVNFINDATFRLKGSETITITNGMDTDSGTVEYVGDGDSVADNFYNQILGFYNLTVNQTDLADALRLSSFSTSTSFMANFDDVPVSNGFIDYSMYNKPVYISGATHSTSSGYLNTGGLTFDGNDLATSSVVTASGNYSWSARVKRLVDTGTYEQIIGINTTDFNSNNGMYIDYNGANDNKVGCYIQPSGTTAWVIYSTSSIPVGSWRTIQCVLTGSELAVWVNGVKENSTNAVSGSLVAGKSFIFGRNGNGNQRYLNGVLDDVQIINRAISTAEIAAINQASAADLNPWLINGSLAIQRGVTYLPLTLSLVRDLTVGVNSFLSATSTTINLTGTDQTITLSATTTFATLTKTLGVGSTTNQTLYFSNASNTPLIITGTTTLSGVSGDGLTLFLRSLASTTPWYFDPQATSSRVFAYIDVQDSTNINATEIDSDNITGYVDSGRNVGWGGASAVITVSKSGTQVATTTTPVDDLALGGAFVFNTTNGDAVISSIKIKQAGSVATTSLTNIRLAYKQEETCSSTTPAGTTAFGNAGSFDANNYATTTGTMSLSEGSPVCLYITYDLIGTPGTSTLGRTIDFEIANPSTDILSADGLATPATHINITGRTMVVDPDYVLSMISLHVSDPTKDPTIYYWKDNAVWKREGNGTAIRLTNPNLQVHNLSFTDLTGPNSNGVVRMEITISNMDPGEEGVFLNVTRTLQTTAGVRARF